MLFDRLLGMFAKDVAMDLGTANTLIFIKNVGIVLNEPSVVAINRETRRIAAVGNEAKSFMGRTPEQIQAIRPMKDGVIADFDVAKAMIKYFLSKILAASRLFRPRLVVGVPTGITQVEKRAVIESAEQAGARDVFLMEEPMAAAIGANLEIEQPRACMIVDIGGGTTETAIISLSATAYKESIRVAGDELNEAIVRYVKSKYHVLIGENMAERVKWEIGRAFPSGGEPKTAKVSGRDIVAGIPKQIQLYDTEITEAMAEPIHAIEESCLRALEKVPPEMAADIAESGITLAGGGALLAGLDQLIHRRTGLPVFMAEDPLTSVVMGAGMVLSDMKRYRGVFVN
ncbi:MAG: rod shape-determining protein [Deltaproteobacteria bacterium]|nr:rod shape-determining protein [Deltaproteobacteria bacterium]